MQAGTPRRDCRDWRALAIACPHPLTASGRGGWSDRRRPAFSTARRAREAGTIAIVRNGRRGGRSACSHSGYRARSRRSWSTAVHRICGRRRRSSAPRPRSAPSARGRSRTSPQALPRAGNPRARRDRRRAARRKSSARRDNVRAAMPRAPPPGPTGRRRCGSRAGRPAGSGSPIVREVPTSPSGACAGSGSRSG